MSSHLPTAGEKHSNRIEWAKVALASSLGSMVFPALEELCWRLARRPSETPIIVEAVLAVGLLAGGSAVACRMFLPRLLAVSVAAFPVAAVSAHHVLHYRYFSEPAAFLLALPSSLIAGPLVAWIALRRSGAVALLLVLALPFAPGHLASREARASRTVSPGRSGPDVVLIVMDTTRRDHLSLYGYPLPTSPSLEAIARDAEVYEDAWSVAPWTPPSHASMLTGLLPAQHGVDGQATPPFPSHLVTLPGILRRAGYRTGGFVANPGLAEKGWAADFDEYRVPWYGGRHSLVLLLNRWREGSADPWRTGSSTKRTLRLARSWWEANAAHPRFAFINILDPHRPYDPPADLCAPFLGGADRSEAISVDQDPVTYHLRPGVSPKQASLLRGLYDGEIAAMDREIGAFAGWLRSRGELDRTILVLTADHGERLGERGLVGHDLVMDPYVLRVPLVVRYPPALAASRIARRVQLDGLPGYILHLAGIPAPPPMEASALDTQDRTIVVAQYQDPAWFVQRLLERDPAYDRSVYSGDWFFAADRDFAHVCSPTNESSPACVLNDLRLDPDWTRDVSGEHPEVVRRLREVGRGLPAFQPPRPHEVDPEMLERLRSLGYVN